jgi:hypothetical protein
MSLLASGELRVLSDNTFTDGSRRDYVAEYRFRRAPGPVSDSPQSPCRDGYVWREAVPGDYVCVARATRQQVLDDNSQAAARRDPIDRTYGPDTCRQGFVWREAVPGDHVCVTGQTRDQAALDNREAPDRISP